jgi:Asp-tRNA(Asn)/Glu-tRNA(Gln) amidotransferase A subunit family amidase
MSTESDRRAFLAQVAAVGFSSTCIGARANDTQPRRPGRITTDMLRQAATVTGQTFTDRELEALLQAANENVTRYEALDRATLDHGVPPPLYFNPVVPGMTIDRVRRGLRPAPSPRVARPKNLEDVAFWPVSQLAALIRTRQATAVELTEMYLGRLKRYDPSLKCVVTLTENLAMREARDADREIAAGRYRGPLHGIPWGVKDLCSVKGYPTTWGAAPFKSRVLDEDATVVSKLTAAGAVLVAKLTTGELALDDVWFGGQTKNPWDLSMGSQGSSAGPASAGAAGLVGFAVGTETGGSIVEPSGICGVSGLRPTFGRVSRHGVMTMSWSLDKIGPMCRSVEDCAVVLGAMQGPDDKDLSVQDVPFNWDATLDVRKLRVGVLRAAFSKTNQTPQTDANDAAALDALRRLGVTLVDVALPEQAATAADVLLIALGEANASLRDPVRTHPGDLVRQDRVARQNSLAFLTATAYLDANRFRMVLMREMARMMSEIDVYVVPFDYADYTPNPVATLNTWATNLTGQPSVTVPHGFNEKDNPTSLTFIGRVFGEVPMLALARAYQEATGWHLKHPKL